MFVLHEIRPVFAGRYRSLVESALEAVTEYLAEGLSLPDPVDYPPRPPHPFRREVDRQRSAVSLRVPSLERAPQQRRRRRLLRRGGVDELRRRGHVPVLRDVPREVLDEPVRADVQPGRTRQNIQYPRVDHGRGVGGLPPGGRVTEVDRQGFVVPDEDAPTDEDVSSAGSRGAGRLLLTLFLRGRRPAVRVARPVRRGRRLRELLSLPRPQFVEPSRRERGPPRVETVARHVERLEEQVLEFRGLLPGEVLQAGDELAEPGVDRVLVVRDGRLPERLRVRIATEVGVRSRERRWRVAEQLVVDRLRTLVAGYLRAGLREVVVSDAEPESGTEERPEEAEQEERPERAPREAEVTVLLVQFYPMGEILVQPGPLVRLLLVAPHRPLTDEESLSEELPETVVLLPLSGIDERSQNLLSTLLFVFTLELLTDYLVRNIRHVDEREEPFDTVRLLLDVAGEPDEEFDEAPDVVVDEVRGVEDARPVVHYPRDTEHVGDRVRRSCRQVGDRGVDTEFVELVRERAVLRSQFEDSAQSDIPRPPGPREDLEEFLSGQRTATVPRVRRPVAEGAARGERVLPDPGEHTEILGDDLRDRFRGLLVLGSGVLPVLGILGGRLVAARRPAEEPARSDVYSAARTPGIQGTPAEAGYVVRVESWKLDPVDVGQFDQRDPGCEERRGVDFGLDQVRGGHAVPVEPPGAGTGVQ